jgi:transposase
VTRKKQPYKTYTKEFKLGAIHLIVKSDKASPWIVAELGIRHNILYK